MKKRMFSYFIAFVMILTSLSPLYTAAYSAVESSDSAFYFERGRGTEDEPYLIGSAEELFRLAQAVNSGNCAQGVFFKLACDIDLGGEAWSPIGSSPETPFSGSFDGGGHTVSGLFIETDAEFAGLFGYSIGAISSVIIKDAHIFGADTIGAIAGFGAAENCVNFADITGKNRVGGIVGDGAAFDCENHGGISGESEVGGIVGRGETQRSANFGEVSGKTHIGGCAGLGTELDCKSEGAVFELSPAPEKANHSIAKFLRWALKHIDPASIPTNANLFLPTANCGTSPWEYLYGSVRVPTSQSTLNNFYNNNYTKSMRRHQYDDITESWSRSTYATDCQGLLDAWLTYEDGENTDINVQMNYQYWCTDKGSTSDITRPYVLGEAVFHYSRRTERMTHIGWVCGFDEDGKALAIEARGVSFGVVVTRVEDRGWTHRGLMTNKFNYDASMPAYTPIAYETAASEAEKFPLKKNRLSPASDVPVWDGGVASGFGGGSGTEQNPYLITNGGELMYLSRAVKNGNSFNGKYFRMTRDIRLNHTSDWQDWDILYGPENEFEPIGYYENANNYRSFRGSFDGGGHTIYGLYYSFSNKGFHGIFGYVGPNPSGCIKNLSLDESYLNAVNNSGGIVGYLEDYGSIVNCRNYATLTCDLWVGGIVGYIKNTTASTLIENCVNSGKVYGTSDTGGIVGFADTSCTIRACSGMGLSKSSDRTGGIIGTAQGSVIENCRNDGIVRGTEMIGGVAGELRQSTMRSCYNAYPLSTKYRTGGLCGVSKGSSLMNCFNTGSLTLLESAGGIVGLADGGRLENCYNVGEVNARRQFGAALGRGASMPAISCVYVMNGCCTGGNSYGTAREGYELASESGYNGFDFSSVWILHPETQYPFAELRAAAYTSSNIPEYEPYEPPVTPTPSPSPTPTPRPSFPPVPTIPPSAAPEPTATPQPLPTQSGAPSLPTPQPAPLWGDVDGNGILSIADAIALMRFAMGILNEAEYPYLMNGDMDGNGSITIGDSIALLRVVMGISGGI